MTKTTIGMAIAAISYIVAMAAPSALSTIAIFTGIVGIGIYSVGFFEVLAERRNKSREGAENDGSAK